MGGGVGAGAGGGGAGGGDDGVELVGGGRVMLEEVLRCCT